MKQVPPQKPEPILHHSMKRILVSYNNRKKHGAHPIVNKTCEGCVSSFGQIVLFSDELPQKGFHSLSEMTSILGEYGDIEVDYIDKSTPATTPQLSLLSKIVLRDLVQAGLHDKKVHDLVWYYATKYEGADVEQELKVLIKWLESEEA